MRDHVWYKHNVLIIVIERHRKHNVLIIVVDSHRKHNVLIIVIDRHRKHNVLIIVIVRHRKRSHTGVIVRDMIYKVILYFSSSHPYVDNNRLTARAIYTKDMTVSR